MTSEIRGLVSVIYSSRAEHPFNAADLADLFETSRDRNNHIGLTGMLLYRSGAFLQLLEGPWKTVWHRLAIIESDPRHTRFELQSAELIEERIFGQWSMAYPDAPDKELSEAPGYPEIFRMLQASNVTTHSQWAFRELTRWFASTM